MIYKYICPKTAKVLLSAVRPSQVSGARHLGVDDERRVPRVPAALGPHEVEGLQRDVGVVHVAAAAALVALVVAVRRVLVVLGGRPDGRVRGRPGLPLVVVGLSYGGKGSEFR